MVRFGLLCSGCMVVVPRLASREVNHPTVASLSAQLRGCRCPTPTMSEGDSHTAHTQYPNVENNQYGAYFRTRNQIKYRDCSTLDACFIEAATCGPSNEEE